MIHQWEMIHYPTDRDSNRYRLSLHADGQDVARLRGIFPGRVGAIWVPRRKPFNCAFFIYELSPHEKNDLEEILSGKIPIPAMPSPSLPAQQVQKDKTKEDTQEIILMNTVETDETTGRRVLPVGYFVPNYMPDAGETLNQILARTLYEKKISVDFKKKFVLTYNGLTLKEVRQLIQKCQDDAVSCVVAVGEPTKMVALKKMGRESKILIRPIPESMLDRNFWLSLIAEIISFD